GDRRAQRVASARAAVEGLDQARELLAVQALGQLVEQVLSLLRAERAAQSVDLLGPVLQVVVAEFADQLVALLRRQVGNCPADVGEVAVGDVPVEDALVEPILDGIDSVADVAHGGTFESSGGCRQASAAGAAGATGADPSWGRPEVVSPRAPAAAAAAPASRCRRAGRCA